MRTLIAFIATLSVVSGTAETRTVFVGDFFFQDELSLNSHTRINAGDSVKWQWVSGSHTTTEVGELWNASINSITQTYTRVFEEPGLWEYFCTMDPLVMRGTVRVDGKMTPVAPSSIDVSPGVIVSGGLTDILESDNQRLVVRPGVVFSNASYPIVVRATGFIPPGTGDHALTIRVEAHATSGTIVQRIRLYDPFQQKWEEVRIGFSSITDTVVEATVNDPERFQTPASGMTVAEVSYRAAGPVFAYPWHARIDQIQWIAQ
jgi:hypothetical protein